MTNISIKNLSKKYNIHFARKNLIRKSFRQEIMDIFKKPAKKDSGYEKPFYALDTINLSFTQGDIVGIIGENGSGKSTLLKIIAGVTTPTTGEIRLQGNIAALLGIGVGFHTDLTGKENIFLNGAILGYKRKDILQEYNTIVRFAGIGKFIDIPVKYYSSGMYVRLAFAIAAAPHKQPEILLLDEILSVGDEAFKQKSLNRIQQLAKRKKTIILIVSHDLAIIEKICTKCIWLHQGKINSVGNPKEVIFEYTKTAKK